MISSVKYLDSIRLNDEKFVFIHVHKDVSAFVGSLLPFSIILTEFLLIRQYMI